MNARQSRISLIADIKAAEDSLNDRRKALDKRLTDGKNKLVKALEPIVKKMIDEQEAHACHRSGGSGLCGSQATNLTKDALQSLDANLQKL